MESSRTTGLPRSLTPPNTRTIAPTPRATPQGGPVVYPFTATIPRMWLVLLSMVIVTPVVMESANRLPVTCLPKVVNSVFITQRRCLTLKVTVSMKSPDIKTARTTSLLPRTAAPSTLTPSRGMWVSMEGASPWMISWIVILTLMLTAIARLR